MVLADTEAMEAQTKSKNKICRKKYLNNHKWSLKVRWLQQQETTQVSNHFNQEHLNEATVYTSSPKFENGKFEKCCFI